jgi:hypothetical protein
MRLIGLAVILTDIAPRERTEVIRITVERLVAWMAV